MKSVSEFNEPSLELLSGLGKTRVQTAIKSFKGMVDLRSQKELLSLKNRRFELESRERYNWRPTSAKGDVLGTYPADLHHFHSKTNSI